jgi:hypothetical protein
VRMENEIHPPERAERDGLLSVHDDGSLDGALTFPDPESQRSGALAQLSAPDSARLQPSSSATLDPEQRSSAHERSEGVGVFTKCYYSVDMMCRFKVLYLLSPKLTKAEKAQRPAISDGCGRR